MAEYNFSPGQQAVANAVIAGRHVDAAVIDIAKEKDAAVRKREARDLWQRILASPEHPYFHPEDANHLIVVDSMRLLGELAHE